MFVVGAKLFPGNQNVKYDCFHCAFQIFHIFADSIYIYLDIHNVRKHPFDMWTYLHSINACHACDQCAKVHRLFDISI